MRRGCECDCHLTNHQRLQLSLTPFEYANSHNSTENEYYWQNICKCSNCISYEPQTTTIIDQSKMFDFDAIQVMEHEELQQLPEAVNREIVKNSEEIVYDEEEKVSERNLIKLNDVKSKFLSYNHFLEEKEEDVLIQKAVEKDMINKEDKEDNQKSIEGEKEAASMQTTLIRLNKDKGSQKVSFKKEKRDFSENYMIRLKEKMTDILKNSQEVIYDDTKDGFLKRNIICGKDTDKLKNCQEVKQAEELLERKLAKLEGNGDTMKNHHIYNKEQLIKVKENPKEIRHLIGHIPYKPKDEYKTKSNEFVRKDYEVCLEKRRKLHNKKCQLIMLVDRDQKNIEKNPENIFMGKERRSQKKFDRSLSDDLLTVSDKRSFKKSLRNRNNNKLIQSINQDNKNSESDPFLIKEDTSSKKYHRTFSDYFVTDDRKENAISNMKNVRILEKEEKSLQQISKYSVASLDHLNSNSISDQQLNFNSLRWENDDSHYQMKQHDHIRIENERIQKKSSCRRPAKIAMQDKFYSNDIRSLNSPVYDFSSESGFCEQNSESNCRELFTRNMKDIENVNSVKSNLSRENIISDIDNPKECIKNHSVEAITNTNIIRNDEIASSYFSLPSKNFVVDGNNLMKYTDSLLIKEQIICIENEEQNIHEAKKKNRCPRRLSRKVISNFYESKKPSSIVEKQLIRNKCIQNIDEEFTTQKSDFINVDVSPKYFVRDNECPEWFDDTIIVERQIDHDITRNSQRRNGDLSSNNISCENVVNDSVVPKHLKQYNSSILTEEQVYGNKMEDRKQICSSSNSNTSYKNFINNTVTLDSRQCDDDFIPENQVVYESERNDDDMTSTKTTTDCFV